MEHVFLSYSRRDTEDMRRVRDKLRTYGFRVWTDEGIQPGTPLWKDAIAQAIEKAGAVVVLLSPDAKQSEWVKRELEYATVQDVQIFSVLLRGNDRDAVPFAVVGSQYIDVRDDFDFGMVRLNSAVFDYARSVYVSWADKRAQKLNELLGAEGISANHRVAIAEQYMEKMQEYEGEVSLRSIEEIQEKLKWIDQQQSRLDQMSSVLAALRSTCAARRDEVAAMPWQLPPFPMITEKRIEALISEVNAALQKQLNILNGVWKSELVVHSNVENLVQDMARQMRAGKAQLEQALIDYGSDE